MEIKYKLSCAEEVSLKTSNERVCVCVRIFIHRFHFQPFLSLLSDELMYCCSLSAQRT